MQAPALLHTSLSVQPSSTSGFTRMRSRQKACLLPLWLHRRRRGDCSGVRARSLSRLTPEMMRFPSGTVDFRFGHNHANAAIVICHVRRKPGGYLDHAGIFLSSRLFSVIVLKSICDHKIVASGHCSRVCDCRLCMLYRTCGMHADRIQAATCAPPPWTAVTPSNRAGRHRAARHGRRWADPAGRRRQGDCRFQEGREALLVREADAASQLICSAPG